MAVQMSKLIMGSFPELRFEPTDKRVRAVSAGRTFADSRRARLVWEPRRVVASYAVPEEDLAATVEVTVAAEADEHPVVMSAGGPPVLDPRTPFAVHSSDGDPVSLTADGIDLAGAGFRLADPELAGYVVLDFAAFDTWLEEDEPIVSHPRDPFSRIDVRRSSSHVQVEVEGVTVADTTNARLLFETHITPRYYLPREDVHLDLLTPTDTRTTCAYKGHATYWAIEVGGVQRDIAWTYEEPLPDAAAITKHVAFFDEHVDLVVDGERRARPVTPWS
jgi:uncharacterized protein (DUF427 family)